MHATRRSAFIAALGLMLATRAEAERIRPEPVFPNLPPALPPPEFTAMALFVEVPLRLAGRPTYESTNLTVDRLLAVLPPEGRTWRRHTADNLWFLSLARLDMLGESLRDVQLGFQEDNMAGPKAVSFRLLRIGQTLMSNEARLRFARILVEWAQNAT